MFVDICSSILTAMSAVVLLQYTLICFYCSLHCMLSCYCFDPSVDLLHAYNIRAVIIMHLLIECHTCYMYCTEASAALVLHFHLKQHSCIATTNNRVDSIILWEGAPQPSMGQSKLTQVFFHC